MKNALVEVQLESKPLYYGGRLHYKPLNADSHCLTAELTDTIYSSGTVPSIIRPTWVTEFSTSLIDNIFINKNISYDESMYRI